MLYLPAVRKEKKLKKDYGENPELFEKLRTLRKKLADEQNVPPYIIFSDTTLKEMAVKLGYLTPEQFDEWVVPGKMVGKIGN